VPGPTLSGVPISVTRDLVSLACRAPSVHNTQPWAWRIRPDGVDLYADHTRQLRVTDPDGRNLSISCGAALHHLQVAASAAGWAADVRRCPDPATPDLLAEVRFHRATPTRLAADELEALRIRATDRRRFTSWPVPNERLESLAATVSRWGVLAVPLTDATDRFRVELLVSRALRVQARDPAVAEEQRIWRDRRDPAGVPSTTVPDRETTDPSHRSRFGTGALEDAGREVGGSDGLVVLCDEDESLSWLRCGEALSALWLHATREGLSVVPLSQVVEVAETRAVLRHELLGGYAHPLLLLRIGWQAIGRSQLVPTPRRPLDDVLLH
jgi:nitroreductase